MAATLQATRSLAAGAIDGISPFAARTAPRLVDDQKQGAPEAPRFDGPICQRREAAVDNQALMNSIQPIANMVLVWIGFGTLVGLLAKAIMPGKDPGGAIATLAMGVAGTVIGCGVVSFLWKGHVVSPISPVGFCVGTGGAFLLLFFYKLLGGYYFDEGNGPLVRRRPFFSRQRRGTTVVYEDAR
jgi:uncharacterized membrane protein YeaQ/YmgE (transglycosylase-associated protein family)